MQQHNQSFDNLSAFTKGASANDFERSMQSMVTMALWRDSQPDAKPVGGGEAKVANPSVSTESQKHPTERGPKDSNLDGFLEADKKSDGGSKEKIKRPDSKEQDDCKENGNEKINQQNKTDKLEDKRGNGGDKGDKKTPDMKEQERRKEKEERTGNDANEKLGDKEKQLQKLLELKEQQLIKEKPTEKRPDGDRTYEPSRRFPTVDPAWKMEHKHGGGGGSNSAKDGIDHREHRMKSILPDLVIDFSNSMER